MDEEMKQTHEAEGETIVMQLIDGNGNPYEATLLTVFMARERDYAAFLSHVPDESGHLPIQIFRYRLVEKDGAEGMEIDNIQSDMEFDEAYNALLPLIEGGSNG